MEMFFYLLLHGTRRTKWMLWGIVLLFFAALVGMGLGFGTGNFLLGAGGFMLLIFSIVLLASISFEKSKQQEKNGKTKPQQLEGEQAHQDAAAGAAAEAPLSKEAEEERQKRQEEEQKLAYLQGYGEKKLKKLLSKGGAKKGHEIVMIDSWPKEKVRQSPAYLWREGNKLVLLVLEKEARKITVSVEKIKKVVYQKGVVADINTDYLAYSSPSLVGMIFAPVLPSYYDKLEHGHTRHCKNLYVLDPGISFTNTSAKGLFSILGHDFPMVDEVGKSKKFDKYFVRAYHYQLLLRDNAVTMKEYQQELLGGLLEEMAHSGMEQQTLVESLKKMMEYKLVPQEQANQCMDLYRTVKYERERGGRRQGSHD